MQAPCVPPSGSSRLFGSRSFPSVSVAILLTVILGPGATTALGWGRAGHRASATLAYGRLTPTAKAQVLELLDPEESLADASTWADKHAREINGSAAWHYVNVPISEPSYDARFCPRSGCVVSKIGEYRRILSDRRAPRAERQKALRFVIHFIQDVQQPLHVGDRRDRGGNLLQVQFFGEGSNLHRVWDSGLISHEHTSERSLVRRLDAIVASEDAREWMRTTPVDWANESLAAAKRAYLDPADNRPLRAGARLGKDYQQAQHPVALRRLAQSGVRLASMLNETLK